MRLINTSNLKLSEFYDFEIPKYAILSHTWGSEEVSYQDWCSPNPPYNAGYWMIYRFFNLCRRNGYAWAWVDTCCIDKTSSAELSEAINSMYRWYQGRVCYAYLVDVPSSDDIDAEDSAFCLSRWFTRGWTLQELVAPKTVYFHSVDWVKIGQRGEHSETVSRITGIPQRLLVGQNYLYQYSVAQKMSWASKRKTTRVEDIAYCLLGLFDVNMPLLYGEGGKAFLRLQEEIMKTSTDHTLFAWLQSEESAANGSNYMDCGLLAPSPEFFAGSSRFVRQKDKTSRSLKPYSMTNRGLEIELSLCQPKEGTWYQLAILNCVSEELPYKNIAILLAPAPAPTTIRNDYFSQEAVLYEGDFVRIYCHRLEFLEYNNIASTLQMIYIRRGGATFIEEVDFEEVD